MLRDLLIAAIRTGVAAAAGLAITWLVGLGVEVPADFEATLTVVVFGLAVAGYNLAVGFLERKISPLFGVLLGVPKAPTYAAASGKHERGSISIVQLLVIVALVLVILYLGVHLFDVNFKG